MPGARVVVKAMPASRAAASRPSHSTCVRALQRVVESRCLDQLQRRQARGHRHRIAAERAGLVDRAARRDLRHQVATAAVGADRHAAADDLAERAQVRRDAVALLRAAERDAEAGHHFVEDQQRAVLRAQLAQVLQVAVARQDAVGVADDRLDDQAGDLAADVVEQLRRGIEIVVGQRQREVGERRRHARRIRQAQRHHAAAGLHQEAVAVAVVAAFELDDAVAAGGAARDADRRQRRLGAGVDHAHHLAARHDRGDRLGHRHFQRIGHAEAQAVAHGLARPRRAPAGCAWPAIIGPHEPT